MKELILTQVFKHIKKETKITQRLWGVDSDNLIFVSHHLPPEKKYLGKKLRDLGKGKVSRTMSFENGDWVAVLSDNSSVIIKNEEELKALKRRLGIPSR